MKPGDRVRIQNPREAWTLARWWPKGEVMGTIQKVYKNGKIAVALDRVRNQSEDGKYTGHFYPEEMEPAGDPGPEMLRRLFPMGA